MNRKTKERLLLALKLGLIDLIKDKIDPKSTTLASARIIKVISILFDIPESTAKKYLSFFHKKFNPSDQGNDPPKEDIYYSLINLLLKKGISDFELKFPFNPNE